MKKNIQPPTETIIPMETVLFTDLSSKMVQTSKMNCEMILILNYIGEEFGLNYWKDNHCIIINRILINMVKWN